MTYEKLHEKRWDWRRCWAAIGMIETAGLVILGAWMLLGCVRVERPRVTVNASLIDARGPSAPSQSNAKNEETKVQAAPECTGDFVECDPVWQQLTD